MGQKITTLTNKMQFALEIKRSFWYEKKNKKKFVFLFKSYLGLHIKTY
jgi:hypothetical protein